MSNLVLKTKVTRSEDGTELYVEFLNATGTYDVTDNPGGFGTPNPARNTLAVLFLGYWKRVSSDIPATPNPNDAASVSSFTIPISAAVNGWIEFSLFAIDKFNPGGTYVDGDITYNAVNPSTPFVQKRILGVQTPITVESLLNETVDQMTDNKLVAPDVERFINELNKERVDKLEAMVKGECGKDDYEPVRLAFDYVDSSYEAAVLDFCSGAYMEAQELIEKIAEFQELYDNNNPFD